MELNYKLARVVAGPLAGTAIDLFTMIIYGTVLLMFNVPLTLIATALTVCNLLYLRKSR